MDGRRIIKVTERYITRKGAETVKNSIIPADAIMMSCIGSDMGKAAIAGKTCITNQQINSIVVNRNHCSKFVYYNLSLRQNEIRGMASGSAVPILNKNEFAKIPISLPSLIEQRAIAQVLGSLDDMIELNRQMNETLEAMARAIFKSWFVDFDPVRAKAEGRDTGLPPDIANLFPDSFEESELGLIPRGWEQIAVFNIAKFVNGAAFKNDDFSESSKGRPIIKIAELKNGITPQTKFTSKELGPKYKIDSGEILFSWSGSPDTSIDIFVWTLGPAWLNQHIFRVTENRSSDRYFIYNLLKYLKPVFIEIARDKQTTGLGHITEKDLKALKICLPPEEVIMAFNNSASTIFEQFYQSILESQTLSKLRDLLLPKLISGEIRVPEANG